MFALYERRFSGSRWVRSAGELLGSMAGSFVLAMLLLVVAPVMDRWRLPRRQGVVSRRRWVRWGMTAAAIAGTVHTVSAATTPLISSAPELTTQVDQSFTYRITINQAWPLNVFDATPLPPGLTISKSLGIIRGKPTRTGTTAIELKVSQDDLPDRTLTGYLLLHVVSGTAPPTFTLQPLSVIGLAGGLIELKAEAAGVGPIRYQWYRVNRFFDFPVDNATNAILRLSSDPFEPPDGDYFVEASNRAGTNRSETVSVGMVKPPEILSQPDDYVAHAGQPVTLYTYADGGIEIFYQWRKSGEPLAGATNSFFEIGAAVPEDAGLYDVVASNRAGTNVTRRAQLTLVPPVTSALARLSAATGRLSFNTIPLRSYLVYYADALETGYRYLTQVNATGTNASVTVNFLGKARYYTVLP